MRKKLLSTLLALSVALTLVPLSALAEGNDGSSDAAGGQQGKVEELTPNLTEVKTETRTDDTSGKSASVIEVSVAPNAKVPFSPKEEAIGRTRDGWWVGVKIVAPKGVILDTSDGTGSSGAVLFRNNGDNEDRAWKEPIVDGGNGSETDPYYMGAWIGPSLEKLAAGETIYNAVWYFNWDGSNDTGITIEKEEFTGATGAADMKGVDQIIKVTFELKDGVQLAGKEESDGLAWPINVTFNTNEGSPVAAQKLGLGGKAEEPSAPTRNGYTFGGWYTEKECKTAWDFNKDTVTRDLTLYAKWTEKTNTGDEPNEDGEYEINIRSGIRHGTVEVSRWYAEPGTRVTITVDPESDYVVDWVEAVRESNGRVLSLTQSGRRYTFTMPASDVTIDAGFRLQHVYTYTYFEPVAPARPAVFTPVFTPASWRSPVALKDVPTTSWNYASAQWAYQNGYLDVAADGTFRLDGPVSHQQMWRIMASWLGESSMSAQELANWAKQNGAANGSPAASSMTRQDVVVYLYQCCFLMGGDVSSSGNLGSYADSRLITASSVRSAWTWAVDKGIISGTADGYLHPGSTVSRGEFAAMLMRLCQSA